MQAHCKAAEKEGPVGHVPGPANDTGGAGEPVNEGSGLGLDTGRLGILGGHPGTRGHKECSIYHYITVCPPVPPGPIPFVCVHALCHLPVCKRNPSR